MVGSKLRIETVIPRRIEEDVWTVMQDHGESVQLLKGNSAQILVPKSLIETFHNFGNAGPSLMQLKGRLQWITPAQTWKLFTEKPPSGPDGEYGIWKSIGLYDSQIEEIERRFGCKWIPVATVALCASLGDGTSTMTPMAGIFDGTPGLSCAPTPKQLAKCGYTRNGSKTPNWSRLRCP